MRLMRSFVSTILPFLLVLMFMSGRVCFADAPVKLTVTDFGGNTVHLKSIPSRIVSLVPGATETIFRLHAGNLIVGLTFHDTYPQAANTKSIVGGFADPSPEIIERLQPDVILYSSFQRIIREKFAHSGITLIQIEPRTIEGGFRMIELLGKLTGKAAEARAIIDLNRTQLDVVSRKVAKIPELKRKRVMRLMGTDSIMTPGDGSFQNEFIRAAGGIAPSLGKSGQIVPMTKEEWEHFDPQLIYYCGNGKRVLDKVAHLPGWKDVAAVKSSNYYQFPCDLTCRASVNTGYFVAWLASVIYPEALCTEHTRLDPDKAEEVRTLPVDLPYVKSARVIHGTMHDFPFQTLCIDLSEPMACLSTLAGSLSDMTTVGNHYSSPPLWNRLHRVSLADQKKELCRILGRNDASAAFLFTGALMDGISVQRTQYKDMIVYALVTAGARGNAIRSGVDEGLFYEPGTINTVILTNMQLSPRAMTRAIISVTEAKSAALQDFDVRSCYTPRCQATGTGTDEIIVVQGRGKHVNNAGGHSKLGELIAKGVHAAVTEAISKQNALVSKRSVFQRLEERKIDIYALLSDETQFAPQERVRLCREMQRLLLKPIYAGLMETSFALSDAYNAGLVQDLHSFQDACKHACTQIAGTPVESLTIFVPEDRPSKPIYMALNALLNGIRSRKTESPQIPLSVGDCSQ